MNNISKYVKELEVQFVKAGGPKGWEHFQGFGSEKRPVWGVRKNPFWWCMLSFSALLILWEILVRK